MGFIGAGAGIDQKNQLLGGIAFLTGLAIGIVNGFDIESRTVRLIPGFIELILGIALGGGQGLSVVLLSLVVIVVTATID